MNLSLRPVVSAAIAMLAVAAATAAAPGVSRPDLTKMRYRIDSKNVFDNRRATTVEALNASLNSRCRNAAAASEQPEPMLKLGPASSVGDLDAPNGERWFYSAEFEYTEIPPHGDVAFTDYILQYYKFDIYDADAKYVGTIRDRMDYADDEVRVPLCELAPVVTRNFFNTDDDLEFIVGLAVNAAPGENHYRSLVYTLGNERDADGDDVPVFVWNNLIGDVVEGPAEDGKDNFYISMIEDHYGDIDNAETFWEYICSSHVSIATYGRALDSTGPRKLLSKDIPLLQLPGDQMSVPAIISKRLGDDVYFMMSWYELPFFNQYDDPINSELSQREGNHLVCAFYKAQGDGIEYSYETAIEVVRDVVERQIEGTEDVINDCLYSFYSVGSLRYSGDIAFTGYNTPAGRAALIVTRSNELISIDGTINSYYVYNPDGTRKLTLWENADSSLALSDIDGFAPQQMFVSIGAYGYEFNFVNLHTGKKDLVLDYQYYIDDDSDPESLTANLDRVPVGDSYEYCIELRVPSVDEDENDLMRFLWVDRKGKFDRIDLVNMGTNVLYAMSYIAADACVPGAYTEKSMAYMMLIKRGVAGEATAEQLLVAEPVSAEQPAGKQLLLVEPNSDGVLASIIPIFGHGGEIDIYRSTVDRRSYALEVYALPLDKEVEGISAPAADSAVAISGNTVTARGDIKVYTAAGTLAASGNAVLSLDTLAPGVYVVVADGSVCKLLVK